ncbi:hypothetical protein MUU72_33795 [Streptomyces sp. RS10V-4]|uniref:hypothetical protein n=1 Tax=Streptomyces rhizoryzae TaxID=2932493 RepID=UPI0020044CAC|nr:hypothetical protein [Streptomyces rhizoryzae]MCK7628004.1 hypothetical protein [Streptomyces rhizoryzae]
MLNVLGIQTVNFDFDDSKDSTRTVDQNVSVPSGATSMQVFLKSFDLAYTDSEEYGFGRLQINVEALSVQEAQCTVTLRDNNTNYREWSGSVTAIAVSFEGS